VDGYAAISVRVEVGASDIQHNGGPGNQAGSEGVVEKPVRHFSANLHHPQLSDFRLQERAKKLAAWDTYRACMVQAVATSSEYWQLAHCEYCSCIVLVSLVHQHTQPLYYYVHSRAIRM
jgi:hypothetical protein